MFQHTIDRQLTHLVIPFSFKQNFFHIHGLDYFNYKPIHKENLFEHIDTMIPAELSHGAIGKAFSLDHNHRGKVGLPHNKNGLIYFELEEGTATFEVAAVDVYLFNTHIGFFVYQLRCRQMIAKDGTDGRELTVGDLVQINYHLKRLFYERHPMFYYKKVSKDETEKISVDLIDMTHSLIQDLEIGSYFSNRHDRLNHLLLFTSVYMKEADDISREQIGTSLYLLKRGYNISYLPHERQLMIEREQGNYQPFSNTFWGVSLEGVISLSFGTDNERTNQFFEHHFFQHIQGTYFYMFMLTLFQRYSLLRLSVRAGQLHAILKEKKYSEQLAMMAAFNEEVIEFTLKGMPKEVSYMTHHATLYSLFFDTFKIENLNEGLTPELNALSDYVNMMEDKEQRKKEHAMEERRYHMSFIIQLVTVLVIPFTLVASFFSTPIPKDMNLTNADFFTLLAITYVISFSVLIGLRVYFKRRRD